MFVGAFNDFKGAIIRLLQWSLYCIMADKNISAGTKVTTHVHKATLSAIQCGLHICGSPWICKFFCQCLKGTISLKFLLLFTVQYPGQTPNSVSGQLSEAFRLPIKS